MSSDLKNIILDLALQLTQALANFSVGKRGVSDFFDQLGQQLLAAVYPIVNQSVQSNFLFLIYSFWAVMLKNLF